MKKSIFKKLGGLFLGLAMGLGVAVGVTAGNNVSEVKAASEEAIVTFDFEDNSAHRTSGSNSFGTNTYSENGATITTTKGDVVTTGTPISGSANYMARIAKNTTNDSGLNISDIDVKGYKVTKITYKTKGVNSVKWQLSYSSATISSTNIGSQGTFNSTAADNTATINASGLDVGDKLTLNWNITVSSSTSSNRDNRIDDIVVYGIKKEVEKFTVSFVTGQEGYGTVSQSSIANVPSGSAITENGNEITINGTTVTATPAANTAQYTYAFSSWNNASGTVTAARTITANFTRTTNTYGVSGTIGNGDLDITASAAYGKPLSTSITPNTNYTYPETLTSVTMGGSTLTAGSGYTYDSSTGAISIASVTGNVVINATCVPLGTAYTVSYNANGGSVSPASEEIIENGNPSFPTPTRNGFNFKGWQVDGSGTLYTNSNEYTVTEDVNFVASWAALYTVSFNSSGGSASPASMKVEDGNTFSFPSAGAKTHYTFDGWSSDGGTNKYKSGTSPAVTANTTYTAYWTADAQYDVTYVVGTGGTGSFVDSNQWSGSYTLKTLDAMGITANEGYRFKNYSVNGSTKNPGDSITLNAATTVKVNFELKPVETTYDFTKNFKTYSSSWSAYGTYELDGKSDVGGEYAATIGIPLGGKQSSNINTMPVVADEKAGDVVCLTFELTEPGYEIDQVSVTFAQWTTKAPTMKLIKGDSAEGTLLDSGVVGTKNTISSSNVGGTKFVIVENDGGSSRTQVGIQSIYISLAKPNALDHVSVSFDNDPEDRTFASGSTFAFNGTLTASYTRADDAEVTPDSYHLDSENGSAITTSTILTRDLHNGHSVYVVYTENGVTKSDSFTLIVNYAPVTSVSISEHSTRIGLNSPYDHTAIEVTISSEYADPGYEWNVVANTVEDDFVFDPEEGLLSGDTAGTITLRCSSTSDSSKYDELVITVSANPTATFVDSSILGYVGKSATIEFTYGNIDDESLITVVSGNQSYFTVDDDSLIAMDGEGLVDINFVAKGTTTVAIKYDGTQLASITVTVDNDEITTISAIVNKEFVAGPNQEFTKSDLTVSYVKKSGDKGTLTNSEFTVTGAPEEKLNRVNSYDLTVALTDNSDINTSVTLNVGMPDGENLVTSTTSYIPGTPTTSWSKLTKANQLNVNEKVYIHNDDKGYVTGYNGSDATVSATASDRVEFSIKIVDSTNGTFKLKSTTGNYITYYASNKFGITCSSETDSSVAIFKINSDGHFECVSSSNTQSRYLCANGNYLRMYTAIGSYKPFDLYISKTTPGQGTYNTEYSNNDMTATIYNFIAKANEVYAEICGSESNNLKPDLTTWLSVLESDEYEALVDDTDSYNLLKSAICGEGAYGLDGVYVASGDKQSSDMVIEFLQKYDRVVSNYSSENYNYLGRDVASPSPRINPILALNEVDNSVWVISAVALVGLTAIGGYFFYRKRKEI